MMRRNYKPPVYHVVSVKDWGLQLRGREGGEVMGTQVLCRWCRQVTTQENLALHLTSLAERQL